MKLRLGMAIVFALVGVASLPGVARVVPTSAAFASGPSPYSPCQWSNQPFDTTHSDGPTHFNNTYDQLGTFKFNCQAVGYVNGPYIQNSYAIGDQSGYFCKQTDSSGYCTVGTFWDNLTYADGSKEYPRTDVYANGTVVGYQ